MRLPCLGDRPPAPKMADFQPEVDHPYELSSKLDRYKNRSE